MKHERGWALATVLLACAPVVGCRHKTPPPPPPAPALPAAGPESMTVILPVPVIPPAKVPEVVLEQPKPEVAETPEPTKKKRPRHNTHRRPEEEAPAAAAGQPPAVSAPPAQTAESLGQLSTGGSLTTKDRTHMLELIGREETRANGFEQGGQEQQENTLLQVRAFLKKARQALDNNDLDGATTLTTKARVLLDELQKS